MNRTAEWWDLRFLAMAKLVSGWSKDPSTQCGAVIVDEERRVVSVGYNGFAKGVHDTAERLNNREEKYRYVIHAEVNAILFADKERLKGATLYTHPFMACSSCAGIVIQSGIRRCVATKMPESVKSRWEEDTKRSMNQFEEAGVTLDILP